MKKTEKKYIIQNKLDYSEKVFYSKDELLAFLEFENHKTRLSKQTLQYHIDYFENEELLNFITIDLPFKETVEKLLKDFHSKKHMINSEVEEKREIRKDKDKEKNKVGNSNNLIGVILYSLFCLLAVFSIIYNWQSKSRVERDIKILKTDFENYNQQKNKIDIFSRYFLVTAYSGDYESLKHYYQDEEILESNIKEGKVLTVNVETIKKLNGCFNVSCIVNIKVDQEICIKRVVFDLNEATNSIWQFEAISPISDELLSKKEIK